MEACNSGVDPSWFWYRIPARAFMRDCLSLLWVKGSACCWYYRHLYREIREGDSRFRGSSWMSSLRCDYPWPLLGWDPYYWPLIIYSTTYYHVVFHLFLFFLPLMLHLLALITILVCPIWFILLVCNLLLHLLQRLSCFIILCTSANTSRTAFITFYSFSFNMVTKEEKGKLHYFLVTQRPLQRWSLGRNMN